MNFLEIGQRIKQRRKSLNLTQLQKVITPMRTFDLTNKYDRKAFEQELMRGNEYLEYVKEILDRGRQKSVNDGLYIGSVLPFGYDKVKLKKGNTLTPNKDSDMLYLIWWLLQ